MAFGRPYLQRTDRPPVRIPRTKRRRLVYDDDDGEIEYDEGNELERQLLLNGESENADEEGQAKDDQVHEGADQLLDDVDDVFYSEDDEDPSDLDPEEVARELEGLRDEGISSETQDSSSHNDAAKRERYTTRSRTRGTGIILEDGHILELVDENGHPYPGEYNNALLDYFERSEDDPSQDTPAMEGRSITSDSQRSSGKRKSTGSRLLSKEVRSQVKSQSPRAKTVRFGSINSEDADAADSVDDEEDDEDFGRESAMDVDETSSEGSSDSEDTEILSSISTSSSSDYSTSVSSSSSENEITEPAEKLLSSPPSTKKKRKEGKHAPTEPQTVHKTSPPTKEQRPMQSSPPGEGLQSTRKRNQRRRDQKKLAKLKKFGEIDSEATVQDLEAYRAKDDTRKFSQSHIESEAEISTKLKDFQARRDELLTSLASGGVDIGTPDARIEKEHKAHLASAESTPLNLHQDTSKDTENLNSASTISPAIISSRGDPKLSDTPMTMSETAIIETGSEPPRRRTKLDIASSRRLLFGSLGVRTPKTKDDEQKLRDDFMKHARLPATKKGSRAHFKFDDAGEAIAADDPVGDVNGHQNQNRHDDFGEAALEADESWRSKINLSAVECCHEGVKLSTPPFPFVQRWDPQQQGDSRKKETKAQKKKRKRNESIYYEDDEHYYNGQNAMDVEFAAPEADVELNYDDPPTDSLLREDADHRDSDEVNAAINEQFMRDAEDFSASATQSKGQDDDLLAVPDDLSECPSIKESDIRAGCIIAFKQLDMSKATNWQPKISDYRTARVDAVLDDGTLQMALAMRDRKHRELLYDEETGDRIYSKLEMPGYDGDDDLEDDGFLEVSFGELIEPRLLEAAETPSSDQINATSDKSRVDPDVTEGVHDMASSQEEGHSEHANGATPVASPTKKLDSPVIVSDGTRTEITQMIKDAGFRSSLGSVVGQSVDQLATDKRASRNYSDNSYPDDSRSGPSTPRFNGFGSSPPPAAPSVEESSPQTTTTSIPKTQFTGDTRQKPTFRKDTSQRAETNLYPELPIMSSQQCGGEVEADVSTAEGSKFGSNGVDHEMSPEDSEGLIDNSQPNCNEADSPLRVSSPLMFSEKSDGLIDNSQANDNTASSPLWRSSPSQRARPTKASSSNGTSDDPETHVDRAFDTLGFENNRIEDDVLVTTFEVLSAENPSSSKDFKHALEAIAKSRQSETLLAYLQHLITQDTDTVNGKEPSSPTPNELPSVEGISGIPSHAPSSENEFPSLESVISTARSSFESVKEERRSLQPQSRTEIRKQLHALPEYRSASNDSVLFPDEDDFEAEGEGETTPKASQQQPSTQVIDLTQSSDPVTAPAAAAEEEGDAGDISMSNSSSLPRGPGWVKKRKTNEGVTANKRVKRVGRRGRSV